VQEARQHLAHLASELLACAAEDIALQDGYACHRHRPDARLTLAQLVAAASSRASGSVAPERGLVFSTTYTLPGAPLSFSGHAAVVEVSRETGQVTIRRYAGVHDCGRIVNPLLVEGQIIGGIAQGLGQALSEDVIYTPEGQPLTGSLLDYALPRAHEIPPLILETLEVPSPTNPLGAKGIGSVSTVPVPAAVANAVLDALAGFGVRHLDTPLTAEKIWRAMQGAGK
jgi:carbon-monoxide dehydrogenase large subunit